jgi:ABC-type polysaccharide/polyol phosphate export permease
MECPAASLKASKGLYLSAISDPLPTENADHSIQWGGDYLFLMQNLILKDFRIRYRNMSLGVFWSLLNPLVMMTLLWFVFTKIQQSSIHHFAVFVLCGLVPYNVFTSSWLAGTSSLLDNVGLIKRVAVPREILPISIVLGNCVHMSAQILLLLILTAFTVGANWHWLWLLLIWPLEIIFVIGASMFTSALNVYVRDVRYVVESAIVILFWLVPIVYDFANIPPKYADIYEVNPIAALVMASRRILLDNETPATSLIRNLVISSAVMLAIGWFAFRRLRGRFYNYL